MGEDGSHPSPATAGAAPAAPDVRAMLLQAVAAHRQGQLAAARAGYEEILRLHPTHFTLPAGIRCYSLQKEMRDGDRELLRQRPETVHLGDDQR